MPWTLFIAALMISSLPTYSWTSIRIRRSWRLFSLAGVAVLSVSLLAGCGGSSGSSNAPAAGGPGGAACPLVDAADPGNSVNSAADGSERYPSSRGESPTEGAHCARACTSQAHLPGY